MTRNKFPVAAAIVTLWTFAFLLPVRSNASNYGDASYTIQTNSAEHAKSFMPESMQDWFSVIGLPIAALWAFLTFSRANQIKTAEVLASLEEGYEKILPTILRIENDLDYQREFREPLELSCKDALGQLSDEEFKKYSETIKDLEKLFRHFFLCSTIRRLGLSATGVDKMYGWYLRLFITAKRDNGEYLRPELRAYVNRYWPSVYHWAECISAPLSYRLLLYAEHRVSSVKQWYNGSLGLPRTLLPEKDESLRK